MNLYVMKVPVISTAHLPGPSALEDASLLYAMYMGGWFVYVEEDLEAEAPKWYLDVMQWAADNGYPWVRFDCDGAVIDKLEKYEW